MIKLDEKYTIESNKDSVTLVFKEEKEKDGKKYVSQNNWHFMTLKQALSRYQDLTLRESKSIQEILDKLNK